MVISQHQVKDKSNEIPAVRDMIDELDLEGVTVTIDAMHTQKETAAAIAKKKPTTS